MQGTSTSNQKRYIFSKSPSKTIPDLKKSPDAKFLDTQALNFTKEPFFNMNSPKNIKPPYNYAEIKKLPDEISPLHPNYAKNLKPFKGDKRFLV